MKWLRQATPSIWWNLIGLHTVFSQLAVSTECINVFKSPNTDIRCPFFFFTARLWYHNGNITLMPSLQDMVTLFPREECVQISNSRKYDNLKDSNVLCRVGRGPRFPPVLTRGANAINKKSITSLHLNCKLYTVLSCLYPCKAGLLQAWYTGLFKCSSRSVIIWTHF